MYPIFRTATMYCAGDTGMMRRVCSLSPARLAELM